MWSASVFFLSHIVVCQFATENPKTSKPEEQTVTPYYALSSVPAPSPVMLRLGNFTIDSTKSFKVPQPSETDFEPSEVSSTANPTNPDMGMFPQVVSVPKDIHFDHHSKHGPMFEDTNLNKTKIVLQSGEDAHLYCRISLLRNKTVSWLRRIGEDDIQLLTFGPKRYAADERMNASWHPGNYKLVIKNVRSDDSGVYQCQISTHPPRISRTYLYVYTPKVMVVDEAGKKLQEKYYEAESTLVLTCKARDVATPVVLTWLHEGRALNSDTTRGGISVKTEQVQDGADSVLRLARVNSSDAGNYTCAVQGARSHTISVHVLNESLAELHAGTRPLHPQSAVTVTTLITLVITERVPLSSPVIIFAAPLVACVSLAQELVKEHFIVLLPT